MRKSGVRISGRAGWVCAAALAGALSSAGAAQPAWARRGLFDDEPTAPTKPGPAAPGPAAPTPATPVPPTPPPAGGAAGPTTAPATPADATDSGGPPAAAATRPAAPAAPATTPARVVAVEPAEPDPRPVFESLFGADAKRIAGTATTKDDAELARKLLDAAVGTPGAPKLQAMLYEKAADFGEKDPAGYAVALQALGRLRELRPAQVATFDDRAMSLQDKQYRAAPAAERRTLADPYRLRLVQVATAKAADGKYDEALALCRKLQEVARAVGPDETAEANVLARQVGERQRLGRRVAELQAKVAGGQADFAAAKELVELLAGPLDDPAKAAQSLPLVKDPVTVACVRDAAAPLDSLDEGQVVRLGDWYRTLAATSTGAAQTSLLRRAAAAYHHFLDAHATADGARLKVSYASQQVDQGLLKAEQPAAGTLSLLSRIVPARDRVSGQWQVLPGGLVADKEAGNSAGLIGAPVAPHGNYEVTMEFASAGASEVGLVLPVGNTSVQVLRRRKDVAMYWVTGASKNWQTGLPDLSKDTGRHTLTAKVVTKDDQAGVLVRLDGTEAFRWEGPITDLAPNPKFAMRDDRLLGVMTWSGKAGIAKLTLKMLSGTADVVDPTNLPPRPPAAAVAVATVPRVVAPGVGGVGGGAGVATAAAGPTDLPADGSRPVDGIIQKTGAATRVYHNQVDLTFTEGPNGRQFEAKIADTSAEARAVRLALPKIVKDIYRMQQLHMTSAELRRLMRLADETPPVCAPATSQKIVRAFNAYADAKDPAAAAKAESALFAAVHAAGDEFQKTAAAWMAYVRQNTSDAEYEAIRTYARTNMIE